MCSQQGDVLWGVLNINTSFPSSRDCYVVWYLLQWRTSANISYFFQWWAVVIDCKTLYCLSWMWSKILLLEAANSWRSHMRWELIAIPYVGFEEMGTGRQWKRNGAQPWNMGTFSPFHVDWALEKEVGGLGSVPVLLVEMWSGASLFNFWILFFWITLMWTKYFYSSSFFMCRRLN